MDPRTLAAHLVELGLSHGASGDPARALRELEDRADLAPSDRRLARGLTWLAERVAVEAQTPPVVAGVRRDRLVRWDPGSVTWVGTGSSGGEVMVRVLRPEAARDPVLRRQLIRDGRALAAVAPVEVDPEVPALRLPLTGVPLSPRRGDGLVRPLLTALAHLHRWEQQGLGTPLLTEEELRAGLDPDDVVLSCLTPIDVRSAAGIAAIARALVDPIDDGPLAGALRGLGAHPPLTVDEAWRTIRAALAETLAARRHHLAVTWRETWHRSRELRLKAALDRLVAASPPPTGRGAVGVDLDGRITVVQGAPSGITWGPGESPETVYDLPGGFRPPVARRLLRARAVSPPNPALDARVQGDPAVTEAICRWVAAGLRLRTVQMLLDRERA